MYLQLLSILMLFQTVTACTSSTAADVPANPPSVALAGVPSAPLPAPRSAESVGLVLKSTDGGATWQDIGGSLPSNVVITGLLATSDKLYLNSDQGLFLANPDSIATRWEEQTWMETRIWGLSQGQNTMYAKTMHDGIYQELPGGVWVPLTQNVESSMVHSIYEALDGTLIVGSDAGIFKSKDTGKTWTKVFGDGIVSRIAGENGVLIASGRKGLLRSTDGGDHWDWALTSYGWVNYVGVLEGGLVAITEQENKMDPFTTRKYTYRAQYSTDSGKTWQIVSNTLPEGDIYDLKQVGNYWICGHQTGIYRSSDLGKTWELVRAPRNERNSVILSKSGDTIYAAMFMGC